MRRAAWVLALAATIALAFPARADTSTGGTDAPVRHHPPDSVAASDAVADTVAPLLVLRPGRLSAGMVPRTPWGAEEWDDLPRYEYRRLSRGRLAVALAGVAVYDFAFYQTLKKPWWSDEKSDFHVIGDWWGNYALEVDKAAHAWSGQAFALAAARSYGWAGMSRRQALLWGGVTSLATLTQIEILDGYTKKYGFSAGDYAANVVGAFYPLAREVVPPLRAVALKMSYHTASFEETAVTPNTPEDYDRQTYWLALDVNAVLPAPARPWWPDWLGIAVGYGVDGAFLNSGRAREVFVSLDLDPTRAVPGDSPLGRIVAPFGIIHLPSPAIRFRADGTKVFALYF